MTGARDRRSRWAGIRRWALGFAVAVLLLTAAGMGNERLTTARLYARHPAPGEIVAVDHQLLHLYCTGSGKPTVVIEAGAGSFSLDWQGVRRTLDGRFRVCAYDRPGLGWSPKPSDGSHHDPVRHLRNLLLTADEPGPYLLVGHSLGGLYVQRYARAYPDQVAGVVLVDSVHPDQAERLPEEVQVAQARLYEQMRLYIALAHLGVPRLAAALGAVDLPAMAGLTPSERELRIDIALSSRYLTSVAQEARGAESMLLEARTDTGPFPEVPLVVVSRGRSEPIPGLPESVAAANEYVWEALQNELSRLSANGRHWIAESSGHNIMFDQPRLIASAIERAAVDGSQAGETQSTSGRLRSEP